MHTHSGSEHTAPDVGRLHVLVAIVLAILSIFAFLAVGHHLMPVRVLVPILLVMAMAQIALQLLYYMRLRFSRLLFAVFFVCGALLGILIAVILPVLLPL